MIWIHVAQRGGRLERSGDELVVHTAMRYSPALRVSRGIVRIRAPLAVVETTARWLT
jgi:hypothetical protein